MATKKSTKAEGANEAPKKATKADTVRRIISKTKQGKAFSKRDITDQLTAENVTATPPEIGSVIKALQDKGVVEVAEAPKGFKGNARTVFYKRVGKI